MGKNRLQPMFEPGALDKTRKNVGPLSKEESLRIAALLGGKIGIEREDEAQTEKYAQIRAQSRRRSDVARTPAKRASPKKTSSSPNAENKAEDLRRNGRTEGTKTEGFGSQGRAGASKGGTSSLQEAQKELRYWDRVKVNFLAAHRNHRIMTLGGAIFSLFSGQRKQERVNPVFAQNAKGLLLEPLKAVHHGSNVLLKEGGKRGTLYRPHPLYREMLEVLAHWQVDMISEEMERMVARQQDFLIGQCASLCKALYTPMVRLLALEGLPLESAVRHYYKLITLRNPDNSTEAHAKKAVKGILENLPRLFQHLRYEYYPLLLKLTNSSFNRYEEFFAKHRNEYLVFLNLREKDLLDVPTPLPPVSPEDIEDTPPPITQEGEEKKVPRSFVDALLILQEMFPKSGIENLKNFPDLLPYFSSLLPLPKDFALISPKDPLHSIVIFMGILRELFFSFGGIRMGSLKNNEWNLDNLQETFKHYTLQWVRYLGEYLPKQILSPLREYCREQEREGEKESTYFQRIKDNFLQFKRILYLPHLKGPVSSFPRPSLPPKQQKLWHLADDLANLLFSMHADMLLAENSTAILNGQDPIRFEVTNLVSERFKTILKRRGLPLTNATLIAQTAGLTGILGEFLNNPDSFYYQAPLATIYRTIEKDSSTPQYRVTPLNTADLIAKNDKKLAEGKDQIAPRNEGHQAEALIPSLGQALKALHLKKIGSALVLIANELPEDRKIWQNLLEQELRSEDLWYHSDKGPYAVLLPDTSGEEAVMMIHRLQKLPSSPPTKRGTFVGISSLKEEWTPKDVLSQTEKALLESQRHRGQAIILFDAPKNRYRVFAPAHR